MRRLLRKRTALSFCLLLASVPALMLALPAVGLALPRPFDIERFFTLGVDGAVPADPFLANGVAAGPGTAVYTASGTGPSAVNTLAPSGSPAAYIDYALLATLYPDFAPSDADKAAGVLPGTMSITEAQGINCMARVQENLAAADLTLADITFMRIFLDNPAEVPRADYAGWNRSYRKYMANVSLQTGELIPAYAPVIFENPTRPARSNIEVATLPVAGWLIEIEVVAAYPRKPHAWWQFSR
jgi:enamine deaminase RidA (YjgF/YER057c/UK114 family)